MECNLENVLSIQNQLWEQINNWYCVPFAAEVGNLLNDGREITLANHARRFKLQTLMEVFKHMNQIQKKIVAWYLEHLNNLPDNFVKLFNQTYVEIKKVYFLCFNLRKSAKQIHNH